MAVEDHLAGEAQEDEGENGGVNIPTVHATVRIMPNISRRNAGLASRHRPALVLERNREMRCGALTPEAALREGHHDRGLGPARPASRRIRALLTTTARTATLW